MISKGIRIAWDNSIEYISIDLSNLVTSKSITSTLEWWKSEKELVKWNTYSKITECGDGLFKVEIRYDSSKNLHLPPNEVCFGKAILWISPKDHSGRACWYDDLDESDDCEAKWERVDNPLIGEKVSEKISRIQREKQAQFRGAFVALDGKCVISGEETIDVLEAAHVISCSSGGAEVIENGILLRADLHRLFDAGKFFINAKGEVVLKETGCLSPLYEELLLAKSLPSSTTTRVRDALKWVAKNPTSP